MTCARLGPASSKSMSPSRNAFRNSLLGRSPIAITRNAGSSGRTACRSPSPCFGSKRAPRTRTSGSSSSTGRMTSAPLLATRTDRYLTRRADHRDETEAFRPVRLCDHHFHRLGLRSALRQFRAIRRSNSRPPASAHLARFFQRSPFAHAPKKNFPRKGARFGARSVVTKISPAFQDDR